MEEGSGETPSPTKLPSKKQVKKEMDRLTTQLQLMTMEKNLLRDRLILITDGSLDNRPYYRPNPFYERLMTQHKQVILDLQTLEQEHTEASQNLKELDKETGFYCNLHSRLLMEQAQLKKKVDMMTQDNEMAQENRVLLKHQLAEMQQIFKDQEEETSDLQTQQLDKVWNHLPTGLFV
ncbi:disks large homolog 5-like [Psammomys obesus]|uniref:disks large homolog 5-like n=1 Tax=Psammomys obesus TaxID=48139 RepID=UPI002452A43C|nr:disks large homolog 5-like [Psammomys obesus]